LIEEKPVPFSLEMDIPVNDVCLKFEQAGAYTVKSLLSFFELVGIAMSCVYLINQ